MSLFLNRFGLFTKCWFFRDFGKEIFFLETLMFKSSQRFSYYWLVRKLVDQKRPLLYNYFEKAADSLLSKYTLSKEQKSSTNIGDNRENFSNSFLKEVLPSRLKVDHGEIWDNTGRRSGQLDTIILRDDAPSLLFGSSNTFLAEGVFAVIEIKSNLTRVKLQESLRTLNRVKELETNTGGMMMISGAHIDRPLRCIFAYAGATWDTLGNELYESDNLETVDLFCILERGAMIKKGLLLNWGNEPHYRFFNGKAAALGYLYFHLVSYATGFLGRTLVFNKYFEPFDNWDENIK